MVGIYSKDSMLTDWQLKQSCVADKDGLFLHCSAIFILLYTHLEVVGKIVSPDDPSSLVVVAGTKLHIPRFELFISNRADRDRIRLHITGLIGHIQVAPNALSAKKPGENHRCAH